MRSTIRIIATLILLSAGQTYAQYFGPVQFLNYPVSAQALGMGGVGTAFISDNAAATIANPAQLGIFSMSSAINAGTDIAGFLDPHEPADFSAINIGTRLNRFWPQLPVETSLGIGFSNVSSKYLPPFWGPAISVNETDIANGVSLGLGFDYLVKVGLGYTLKWINLPDPYFPVKHTAQDLGALFQIPISSLICHKGGRTVLKETVIEPTLDLNLGYAMRNFGGYVNSYETLPTEADLGWSIDAGLKSKVAGCRWEWLSISWSEQAGAFPIYTDSTIASISGIDTTFNYVNRYEKGLGRFGIWRNLIVGRGSQTVGIRKSGQIGLGEFLYIRAGSITDAGQPTYTTFGWGLRLDGLAKCLVFFDWINPQSPVTRFLLDHLDFQYD